MNLGTALRYRDKVEEFRKNHRVGLVTLLFTDIVGSTKLKQELGDTEAVPRIQHHHALIRETLSGFKEGEEIGTAGDSFFIVFAKPSDAVKFSLLLQAALREAAQETGRAILDRIGIHVGEVVIEEQGVENRSKDLYGIQVDTCSRIMSLASGNQILMSRFAFDSARQVLKGRDIDGIGSLTWLNHGHYVMKGVEESLEVCEVGEVGYAPAFPPTDSDKAHRQVSADGDQVLGWRPALDQVVPNTKWILEKKLGEGAFGEVWLARHQSLKEHRVFKFCFHADRVRSLKREMTLFRVLKERIGQHPNIVGIQDVYFDQPPFYLVMDYAEGVDLRAWCEQRVGIEKIPFKTRLEIVAQVADALAAAHTCGVIHRDVKPSNIIVTESGADGVQVKLTDFGIGQVMSAEALEGITRFGFTATAMSPASSSQAGTQMYLAPELLAGQPATEKADIFSLGVVLYQFLVGDWNRPLTSDWKENVSQPYLRILERCFIGNPKQRLDSAARLAKELRSVERYVRTQRWIGAGITTLLTLLFGLLLSTPLKFPSEDLLCALRPQAVPSDVVVVFLDDVSHQMLGQPLNKLWDRSLHAQLVRQLKAEGAKAIVFDMIFADTTEPKADRELAAAFKAAGNVILAGVRTTDPSGESYSVIKPAPFLLREATNWGLAALPVEFDFSVRDLRTAMGPAPTLAAAAASVLGISIPAETNRTTFWSSSRAINYYGKPYSLPSVSYFQVISNYARPGFFRDKVVFIGAHRSSGFAGFAQDKDSWATPYTLVSAEHSASVEIQATQFLNLLRRDWIRVIAPAAQITAMFLIAIVFSIALRFVGKWTAIWIAVAGSLAIATLAYTLLRNQLFLFNWLVLVFEIVFALTWILVTDKAGYFSFERRGDGLLVGYLLRRRK
jgi:serine/threonine protein kinase/class 3 adenylate cyclase